MLDEATCRAILFPIAGPGAFNPQSFQRNWYETIISISKVFHGKVRRPKLDEIEWNRWKCKKSRYNKMGMLFCFCKGLDLEDKFMNKQNTQVKAFEKLRPIFESLKKSALSLAPSSQWQTSRYPIWQPTQVFSTAWDESCETACLKRCFSCTRLPSQDLEASWVSNGRLCGTMLPFAGCRSYMNLCDCI